MENRIFNVAAYCRVSTSKQVDNGSLDEQEKRARQICAERGYNLAGVYREEGRSGSLYEEREELQRLIADGREGKFEFVLIAAVDRLARTEIAFAQIVDALEHKLGIQVVDSLTPEFINPQEFNPRARGRRLMQGFKALIAQDQYYGILENMEAGRRRSAARGNYLATRMPFGYRAVYDPATGKRNIEPDPDTYPILTCIKDWFLSGITSLGIVPKLEEMGIKPARTERWNRASVDYIIKNPFYAGRVVYGRRMTRRGKIVKNWSQPKLESEHSYPHPWTWEEFQAMQELMAKRAHYKGATATSARAPLGPFLRCECGRSMVFRTTNPNRYGYIYYYFRCSGWQANRGVCTPHSIAAKKIIEALREALDEIYASTTDPARFEELVKSRKSGASEQIRRRLERTRSDFDGLAKTAGELDDRLLSGKIDFDTFDRLQARLKEKRAALEEDLCKLEMEFDEAQARETNTQRYFDFSERWQSIRERLMRPLPQWEQDYAVGFKETVGKMLDKIIIHKEENVTTLEFRWRD